MKNPDAIRVAVVISDTIDSKSDIVAKSLAQLKQDDFVQDDIEIFHVPTDLDLVYGCSVIFDHLLVDGTIAISSQYDLLVAGKLMDLQVECDFPIEYRWDGMVAPKRSGIAGMISMIDDVLVKADGQYEPDITPEFVSQNRKKKSPKVN